MITTKTFIGGTKKMNSQQMVKDGRLKTIYGKKHNNPNYMKEVGMYTVKLMKRSLRKS